MADSCSGYVLPAGNLQRAAQLRALAEAAESTEGRRQFARLADIYERMAAALSNEDRAAGSHEEIGGQG